MNKRNLFEIYKKVAVYKGSCEIDGMKVDELLPFISEHYEILKANLLIVK
ncbi:MAG: hypothetical protein H5T96_06930 [Tissierellales bacterium]|nr:hypothetical protein [Tissierellales bacterium]